MLSFITRRIAAAVGTLFLSSILVFLAVQALPGDVATQILGKDATPDAVAALRKQLKLDQPAWERYWTGSGAPCTATSAPPSSPARPSAAKCPCISATPR
jgi:ABC-type dipeptide/oligopeptide/nickel transport system permease component